MKIVTLPGNFQIPIASKCNLHCKNCGFMDYNMTGVETIEKTMDVDDVIYLDKKITDLKLKLNNLQFVHIFYHEHSPISGMVPILQGCLEKIKPISVYKVKANLFQVYKKLP